MMPPVLEFQDLDPTRDRDAVLATLRAASDYALLEVGEVPDEAAALEFFTSAPPDHPADRMVKRGLSGPNGLRALIDIARDFPDTGVWYIGLLLLTPEARGAGLGTRIVTEIAKEARAEGAHRLLVCVLDENPRGLRFWQTQGFTLLRSLPPRAFGQKMHTRKELYRDLREPL